MSHSNSRSGPYYPYLPLVEVFSYCAIYTTIIIWSIGSLSSVSKENESRYIAYDDLEAGWYQWIGHYKDTSDFEWNFWENYYFVTVIMGFFGHFIIARIADTFCSKYRFDMYCVYSIVFTLFFLRIEGITFLLSHFTVQYIVAVITKSAVACWISGCLLAYTLTSNMVVSYLKSIYVGDDYKAYFVLFTTAMCNLRYISFSMEYVWSFAVDNHEKSDTVHNTKCGFFSRLFRRQRGVNKADGQQLKFSFKDLVVYQMYFPLCYGGPVINYNEFLSQLEKPPSPWNLHRSVTFIFGVARYIFWHIILDILLHFFYVPTMVTDYALISRLPLFNVLGLALGIVVFFCMKYVCMYGLTSFFSSSDDLNVPGPPHCIFVKHRVTDMWKFFDKGLHLWLVRYIFIPLGGSKVSLRRFCLNSILPFAFVYIWHGAGHGQMVWACLSWLGVFLESLCYQLYKTDAVQSLEHRFLSPAWSRRIRAMLSAPLQSLLLTSNLFFLCTFKVSLLFCSRFYLENVKFVMFFWAFLYTGCQTSMELHRLGV